MRAFLLVYNPDESAVLRLVLQRAGLAAAISTSLEQAVEDWPRQTADLIVLAFANKDIPLPFIRQLRGFSDAPILLVADPLPEDLQVGLLEAGADLLVFRPFSARVLIAQVRVLLRRAAAMPYFSLPALAQSQVSLDPSSRLVTVDGRTPQRLTQLEFRLLYTLMNHPDQVYPAEALVEHVWGYSGSGDRDLVRGLIRRLRAKIEPDPSEPRHICTLPGVGYFFKSES